MQWDACATTWVYVSWIDSSVNNDIFNVMWSGWMVLCKLPQQKKEQKKQFQNGHDWKDLQLRSRKQENKKVNLKNLQEWDQRNQVKKTRRTGSCVRAQGPPRCKQTNSFWKSTMDKLFRPLFVRIFSCSTTYAIKIY